MRIGIGPSSFAQEDKSPYEILLSAGVTVVPNPVSRRMNETEIIHFLKEEKLDGLLAGLEPLNREVLRHGLPNLKAVARVGIGITNVDVAACKEFNIAFSFTPDAPTAAVAEMTLGALLCLTREIESMNRGLHQGQWPKTIARSLQELKVLIVGYGRIGQAVARCLDLLGCELMICDPMLRGKEGIPHRLVSLEDGLKECDVVSLHASGVKSILGEHEFAQAKPGMILLNSARAELVDEKALIGALKSGAVGKAWFDAFWVEPYRGALLEFPQMLLTPHACTYTRRCRRDMESEAVRNLLRDLGK